MNLIPFLEEDLERISAIQPEGWINIRGSFDFYLKNNYCHPLKVESKNELIGVGCSIVHGKTGWLAHIIVSADYRNHGIGGKITSQLIKKLRDLGCSSQLLIATDFGKPVYLKHGFKEVMQYQFFLPKLSKNSPMLNVEEFSNMYLNQLLELDAYISGESRAHLLKQHLNGAKMVIEQNTLTGFYIPDLGEGMIYALTENAGKKLLMYKHSEAERKTVLPVNNYSGMEFLSSLGMAKGLTCSRMCLGKPISWHPEFVYSRIGGNLG